MLPSYEMIAGKMNVNILSNLTLNYALHGEHSKYLEQISNFQHIRRTPEIKNLPDFLREAVDLACGEQGQFTTLHNAHFTGVNPSTGDFDVPEGEPDPWQPWYSEDRKIITWNGRRCTKTSGYAGWLNYICTNMFTPWGYKLSGEASILDPAVPTKKIVLTVVDNHLTEASVNRAPDEIVPTPVPAPGPTTEFAPLRIPIPTWADQLLVDAPLRTMTWSQMVDEAPPPRATGSRDVPPQFAGGNYYGFRDHDDNVWHVFQAPTPSEAERAAERSGLSFTTGRFVRNPSNLGNRISGVRSRSHASIVHRADGRIERIGI